MRAKSKLEVRIRSEARVCSESRVCSELCSNKTPAQAFTPPAEKKIGTKWAIYVQLSTRSGREHKKWLFKNI